MRALLCVFHPFNTSLPLIPQVLPGYSGLPIPELTNGLHSKQGTFW